MKTRSDIQDYLEHNYPNDMDKILLADGFEEAFIGVENYIPLKALYDTGKCKDIIMERGMDENEAEEFLWGPSGSGQRWQTELGWFWSYNGPHSPEFTDPLHHSWLEYNEGDVNHYSDWAGEE